MGQASERHIGLATLAVHFFHRPILLQPKPGLFECLQIVQNCTGLLPCFQAAAQISVPYVCELWN